MENVKSILNRLFSKQNASFSLAISVLVFVLISLIEILVHSALDNSLKTPSIHMTPPALLALLLCATGLIVQRMTIMSSDRTAPSLSDKRTWWALALASIVFFLGFFEFKSAHFDRSITWDNLVHGFSQNITPPQQEVHAQEGFSALFAILAGLGFFTLTLAPTWPWVWQFFPCMGIIFASLGVSAYSFDLDVRNIGISFPNIAITTCIGYLMVYIGMLFLRPDVGLFRPFSANIPGSVILRKRGPVIFVLFFLVAKALHLGVVAGIYSTTFALLTFATLSQAAFFFVFYALARELNVAHARLKRSEIFSQSILDICPSLITIFRAKDNRYIFASRRLGEVLGYTADEITNQDDIIGKLVHPEDRDQIITERIKMRGLKDNETHTYQFRWRHKNGSWRTFRTTTTPYRRDLDGFISHLLSSTVDITDLEQLRTSLEVSNQQLVAERQKLIRSNRDLEIFASVAAHDLKSPLQSVLGWISALRHSLEKPRSDLVENAINFIEKSANKSIVLINDLLNISRLKSEPINHVRCNISQVVAYVLASLQHEVSKVQPRITVGNLPDADGIQVQYENLFSNLIRNAINYRCPDRPLEIEISGHEAEENCEFYVKDNGLGIPTEHHESIFDLFTRVHTDDERPGNGMGLAYCRKVIDLLGGKIWVESNVDQGSTFRFSVPKR